MIVAEKLGNDITTLGSYENLFAEGDTGEVRIFLDRLLYQDEMDEIERQLRVSEISLISVSQDARMLVIKFRKAVVPLLIIAGIVAAIGIVILGWQLLKHTALGIPVWAWVLGGIGLGFLIYRKLR